MNSPRARATGMSSGGADAALLLPPREEARHGDGLERRRGGPCKPGAFLRFETPRQKPARRQQTPTQTQTLMIPTICVVFLFFFDESQAVGSGVGAGESHAGAPTAVVSAAPRSTPASLAALSRADIDVVGRAAFDRGRDGRRVVRRRDFHFVGHDDAAGLQPPPRDGASIADGARHADSGRVHAAQVGDGSDEDVVIIFDVLARDPLEVELAAHGECQGDGRRRLPNAHRPRRRGPRDDGCCRGIAGLYGRRRRRLGRRPGSSRHRRRR